MHGGQRLAIVDRPPRRPNRPCAEAYLGYFPACAAQIPIVHACSFAYAVSSQGWRDPSLAAAIILELFYAISLIIASCGGRARMNAHDYPAGRRPCDRGR